MKNLILQIKKEILTESIPHKSLIKQLIEKLDCISTSCIQNNPHTETPNINVFNNAYERLKKNPFIQNKNTTPMLWSSIYSLVDNEISRILAIDPEADISRITEDYSKLDGWQSFLEESNPIEEKDTTGLGSLDAMFFGFENNKIKESKLNMNNFSFKHIENKEYIKFKVGLMTEHSVIDTSDNSFFSCINTNGYLRYNFIQVLDDNCSIRVVVSKGDSKKTQVTFYLLDSDSEILQIENGFNFLHFISLNDKNEHIKLINSKKEKLNFFNSLTYSYEKESVVFKGLTQILSITGSSNLFSEPKHKGFEFAFENEYVGHKEIQKEKTDETLSFRLSKNQGGKIYGDKANFLLAEIIQPDFFLLEDFTDLEASRIALNVKQKINIPNLDNIDFSNRQPLIDLLGGNLYKFEALDSLSIYDSNIDARFGSLLIQELFQITKNDVMVEDYLEYKTKTINDDIINKIMNDFCLIENNKTSLNGYVFELNDVITFDERQDNKQFLGQILFTKKEFFDSKYRGIRIESQIAEFLQNELELTLVRDDLFLWDQRRFYKHDIKSLFLSLGAEYISNPCKSSIPEPTNIMINKQHKVVKTKNEKDEDVINHEFKLQFIDKEYYNIRKEPECFESSKLFAKSIKELGKIKEIIDRPKTLATTNSIVFSVSDDNLSIIEGFIDLYENITIEEEVSVNV